LQILNSELLCKYKDEYCEETFFRKNQKCCLPIFGIEPLGFEAFHVMEEFFSDRSLKVFLLGVGVGPVLLLAEHLGERSVADINPPDPME
jgi:hypothetical protein